MPVLALLATLALAAAPGPRARPPVDVRAQARPDPGAAQARLRASGVAAPDRPQHVDPRSGRPTFLWASPETSRRRLGSAGRAGGHEELARGYLADLAPAYGVRRADAERAPLRALRQVGGVVLVRFAQEVAGLEVFQGSTTLVLTAAGELVAASGHPSPAASDLAAAGGTLAFPLDAAAAVARAFADLSGGPASTGRFVALGDGPGGWSRVGHARAPAGYALARPARARPVAFDLGAALEPAWHLELSGAPPGATGADAYAYVVSARDGRILFRTSLTAEDAFTYRVYADAAGERLPWVGPSGTASLPHPTGVPDGFQAAFVAPSDVTLASAPFSRADPWLAAGALETSGNNVDAYADLLAPDGLGPEAAPADPATGDFRAQLTGPSAFLHRHDPAAPPTSAEQRQAAVTALFYLSNYLHDWLYDAGFDEAAGNAQASNHGRGGLEGDPLLAEAQDHGGTSNASMTTPADGASPRMQIFVFDAFTRKYAEVLAPAALAGRKEAGTATFGPQAFDVTGDVVLAQPPDGCAPLANGGAAAGRVVLVDRGTCAFAAKAANAAAAGAVGLLVVNTDPGIVLMAGTGPELPPSLSLLLSDGVALKERLAAGDRVSVRLFREAAVDRDGAVDTALVAHEWMHLLSSRLVGNGTGLSTTQARGLAEGWSDFGALLLLVRPEDAAAGAGAPFGGAFALGTYVMSGAGNDGYYFGMRRVPYSTDLAVNALTFRHVQDGTPLPAGPPTSPHLASIANSEEHNTGEVWATMLWECYAALLRAPRLGFDEARQRMKEYLVASLQATPPDPTFTEARDALLAVAWARDPLDFDLFAQAFARRGLGVGAVAPDRFSPGNLGAVESFSTAAALAVDHVSVDDAAVSCDGDGFVDAGETGRVRISVRNAGAVPLAGGTAEVAAASGAVVFPDGPAAALPPLPPLGAATVSIPIAWASRRAEVVGLTITVRDPALAEPRVLHAAARLGVDVAAEASATDSLDTPLLLWTAGGDGALSGAAPWSRSVDPATLDATLAAPDPPFGSDQWIVSPPLAVSEGEPLVVTLRHRFSFDGDEAGGTFLDGGRIELSTDDGLGWTDVGAAAAPAYGGVLALYEGNPNPLAGHAAYVGRSAGYPALQPVRLELDTAYRGRTIRLRFRVAADASGGAPGWELDDVAFSGLAGTPFAAFVPDAGACPNRPPVARAGAPQRVAARASATLDGAASFDPDGDALAYEWTQLGGPPVVLSSAAAPGPSFDAGDGAAGAVLTFSLVVRDAHGAASAPATTTVTVDGLPAPPAGGGCGCTTPGDAAAAALLGLALAGGLRRRGAPRAAGITARRARRRGTRDRRRRRTPRGSRGRARGRRAGTPSAAP